MRVDVDAAGAASNIRVLSTASACHAKIARKTAAETDFTRTNPGARSDHQVIYSFTPGNADTVVDEKLAEASATAASVTRPLTRVPPNMPAACPGLNVASVTYKDSPKYGRSAEVGRVKMRFDIDVSGRPQNITVVQTNADCFRAPAIDALTQWTFQPGSTVEGVENLLSFRLTQGPEDVSLVAAVAEFASGN